jgi:hypothetical protein
MATGSRQNADLEFFLFFDTIMQRCDLEDRLLVDCKEKKLKTKGWLFFVILWFGFFRGVYVTKLKMTLLMSVIL